LKVLSRKVVLRGVGEVEVEVRDDKVSIFTSKGFLKKRKESVKELLIDKVKAVKLESDVLTLVWQDGFEHQEVFEGIPPRGSLDLAEVADAIKSKLKELLDAERKKKFLSDIVLNIFDMSYKLSLAFSKICSFEEWNSLEALVSDIVRKARLISDELNEFNLNLSLNLEDFEKAFDDYNPPELAKACFKAAKQLTSALSSLGSIYIPRFSPNTEYLTYLLSAYYAFADMLLSTSLGLPRDAEKALDHVRKISLDVELPSLDAGKLEQLIANSDVKGIEKALSELHEEVIKKVKASLKLPTTSS